MTIVTARPPRRKPPKPSAKPRAEIAVPPIVKHPSKWERIEKPMERDPEAEASVIAFFRRMGFKVPDDLFDR